jgi:hypothetical protein
MKKDINCARLIERRAGLLVLAPDTPESIPGNAQYAFIATLPPRGRPLRLRIQWPDTRHTGLRGFDYPNNHNFAAVLPDILFTSPTGLEWRRVDGKPLPDGAELAVPAGDVPLRVSVGVPYFESHYMRLIRHAAASGDWEVRETGASRGGRPLHGLLRRPRAGGACRGLLVIQAYQHYSEWAGLHVVDQLVRRLADAVPGADRFAWAVTPCINRDALAEGWRGDRMHNGDGVDWPCGGNFNRDWDAFRHPETRAAAAFYRDIAEEYAPLHGLDLHMGWSSPEHSGGGLTVFRPGHLPEELAAIERRFTGNFFREVPIEPFAWENSERRRPNFAAWFTRSFNAVGQTVEISRFRGFDAAGKPQPVSQAYYQSLGPRMAAALSRFYG